MQPRVIREGEIQAAPAIPEDVEVLAPNHRYLSAFPKRIGVVLLVTLVFGALAPFVPGGEVVTAIAMPVSLFAGVRLGAWLEQTFYAWFYRKNFILRLVAQGVFSIGALFATIALTIAAASTKPTLPLMIAVIGGGSWAAVAALGSIVILTIDVLASALSDSFRVRVACAVLGLIGSSLLAAFGLAYVALDVTRNAAQGKTSELFKINIDIKDNPEIQQKVFAMLADPTLSLFIVFGAASLFFFPAVVSAGVKFADAVMDRIYPMKSAFAKVGEGSRRVQLEVDGSRDFKELARAFNQMVARLRLAERMERAFGVYVSGHVLEKIKAQHGEAVLPAALKEATVFFADIRGFTALSEKLSPEAMVSLLNRYFEQAISVIQAHDGYLNKFIGDAIVVVFNGPIDQPDHAERAVKCAVALQQRVAELNAKGVFPEVDELKIGVGISTGPMTCGNIGSARQMEYTVIGDTVNLAARLTSHAGPTEVWISERTASGLPQRYGAAALPPIKVKGKEAEVTPWLVATTALARGNGSAVA